MPNLPSFIPAKPRRRRKRRQIVQSPPGPAALNLTEADADTDKGTVTLTFDRDVDVSAMDVTAIRVGSSDTGSLYQGDGPPTVFGGQIVIVNLIVIDTFSGSDVELSADADNGIVAVDDGGTWAGCSELALPFGS
jgi:hypothetical protein